ncbi:MAG: hypothetical protein FWC39_02140 [Bacteroidetes bacterium]|nr:hypothetical protein [Bacteroidota bacterium]
MKKIIIILSTIALIASSCGQTESKQKHLSENAEDTLQSIAKKIQKKHIDYNNKLHEKFQNYTEHYGNWMNTEYYQNIDHIGLGVVNPKDFHFYFIADTINMEKVKIEDIEVQEFLIPLIWKPGYKIFYMTVVGISENFYQVRANNEMTVWVNKNEFDFYTWEDLLENALCILSDVIYKEKNISSKVVDFLPDESKFDLIVEKVEGNWGYCRAENFENNEIKGYYWVRWKDENNTLLIRPIFLM